MRSTGLEREATAVTLCPWRSGSTCSYGHAVKEQGGEEARSQDGRSGEKEEADCKRGEEASEMDRQTRQGIEQLETDLVLNELNLRKKVFILSVLISLKNFFSSSFFPYFILLGNLFSLLCVALASPVSSWPVTSTNLTPW